MPSPFDALDTLTITEPPAAAAEPDKETPAPEQVQTPDTLTEPTSSGNGLLDSFDAFFNKGKAGEKVDVEAPTFGEQEKLAGEEEKPDDTKVPEQDPDELETPEMTAAKAKMSMKAAEAFDKVKASAKAKLEDLRAKLALAEEKAANATTSTAKDLEEKVAAAEAKLKEQEAKLAFYDVREHPEYKEAVEAPSIAVSDQVKRLALVSKLEVGDLVKAIVETDPAKQSDMLDALVENMRERDKVKLFQLAEDWSVIAATEQRIKDEAPKAYAEVQAKRQAEAEAKKVEATTAWKQASDTVWNKLAEKIPAIKDVKPEALRAEYDKMDLESMSVTDKVAAVAASVAFVPLVKQLTTANAAKDAEIKELKTQLGKYRKATPGAGGGGSTQVTRTDDAPGGFLESIERHAMGARG